MPDELVHKLIVPAPKEGNLNAVILCWSMHPVRDLIVNVKFSTNINEVDCAVCLDLWRHGIYA